VLTDLWHFAQAFPRFVKRVFDFLGVHEGVHEYCPGWCPC